MKMITRGPLHAARPANKLMRIARGEGSVEDAAKVLKEEKVGKAGLDWALTHACCCGSIDIVKLLLAHGANPRAKHDMPIRSLWWNAMYKPKSIVIAKILIQHGADLTRLSDRQLKLVGLTKKEYVAAGMLQLSLQK